MMLVAVVANAAGLLPPNYVEPIPYLVELCIIFLFIIFIVETIQEKRISKKIKSLTALSVLPSSR